MAKNNKNQNTPKVTIAQEKSYNRVCVKSKLPFGLKFNTPDGKVWEIKGMNQSELVTTQGRLGVFATSFLPEEAWAYFAKINQDKPYLRNKHIFAEVSAKKATAMALEMGTENKTKLEQINPKEVPNIKTAEEKPNGAGVSA